MLYKSHWNLQVAHAFQFNFRQLASANVGLDRGQKQQRRCKSGVSLLPPGHELILAAPREMNIFLLLGHGCFPRIMISTWGLVVMAHEEAGLIGRASSRCMDLYDQVPAFRKCRRLTP